MGVSINFIQQKVWDLASKIDAPKSCTTVFSTSPQDGRPHIEIQGSQFRLVYEERGIVFAEITTQSLDQLLYWIFCSITSQLAQEYELRHRDGCQDTRRILFCKQLELMKKLSSAWYSLLKDEIENILAEHPFNDERT